MLAVTLLALSLSQAAPAQSTKLDQMAKPAEVTPAASKAVAVVLDCQIAAKALTDCKAVNTVADSGVVAEAVRMAASVAIPDALADSGIRIRIRMNVAP
jgi:hypothetical protein